MSVVCAAYADFAACICCIAYIALKPINPPLCFEFKIYERPLIPGLYLMLVNNCKIIMILNDSLNPAHPVVIA